MKWQEYQEAVALLYEQLDDLGTVRRNVFIPDKVTGQPRQVDVLVEIRAYEQTLRLLVDAKFHQDKIDVKDVEEVLALADAVNAPQAVIVAPNGWTEPAAKKAKHANLSLRLLDLEDALELLVPDKWEMCPNCKRDCIVLDLANMIGLGGGWLWFLAGRCRECKFGFVWCQDCGANLDLPFREKVVCGCGHEWESTDDGLQVCITEDEPD